MRIGAGAAAAANMAACSSIPCSFPTKPDPHRRGRSSLPSSYLPRLPATQFRRLRSHSAAGAAPSASRLLRPRASVSASTAPSKDYEASTSLGLLVRQLPTLSACMPVTMGQILCNLTYQIMYVISRTLLFVAHLIRVPYQH